MDLHRSMRRFRLASRELFNNYFLDEQADEVDDRLLDGFDAVENLLFATLVLEPCSVPPSATNFQYGIDAHPSIRVRLPNNGDNGDLLEIDEPLCAPILINREKNSGYWDYPLDRFSNEAKLLFVGFFDWDARYCRDNTYVLVQISEWPSHPEVIGKRALIEAQYVQYELIES